MSAQADCMSEHASIASSEKKDENEVKIIAQLQIKLWDTETQTEGHLILNQLCKI